MQKTAPRNKRSTRYVFLFFVSFFSFLFFSTLFLLLSFRRDVYCFGSNEFQRWNPFDFPKLRSRRLTLSIFLKISPISFEFPFLSIRNAINRRRRRRRLLEHRVYIIVARNETLPERNSRGCRNLRWWNNVHDLMLNPLETRAPDRGNYRGWDPLSLKSCAHYVLKIYIPVRIRPTTSSKTSPLGNFWNLSSGNLAVEVYAASFEREIYFSTLNNFEI